MGKVIRPFCWHQNFVPKELSTPAPGLYTCGKTLKNMYKIRVERDFFLNLQQMVKVIRPFCWHQTFDPKGLSAPVLGLYTCGKTLKNEYKIRVQRNVFETYTKWAKWQGLSVDINICPQGVVCPCPGAIYMYKSIKTYTRTRCQVSVYRTTGPLVFFNVIAILMHFFTSSPLRLHCFALQWSTASNQKPDVSLWKTMLCYEEEYHTFLTLSNQTCCIRKWLEYLINKSTHFLLVFRYNFKVLWRDCD